MTNVQSCLSQLCLRICIQILDKFTQLWQRSYCNNKNILWTMSLTIFFKHTDSDYRKVWIIIIFKTIPWIYESMKHQGGIFLLTLRHFKEIIIKSEKIEWIINEWMNVCIFYRVIFNDIDKVWDYCSDQKVSLDH